MRGERSIKLGTDTESTKKEPVTYSTSSSSSSSSSTNSTNSLFREERSARTQESPHRMPSFDSQSGNWLINLPAYRGLFTYEVGDQAYGMEHDPSHAYSPLGNGVFLWQLEILANTMEITGASSEGSTVVTITCQMKKMLLDLPPDASPELQHTKRKHVVEQWFGVADLASKAFKLDRIDEDCPPIFTDIAFEKLPVLKRDVIAGCYEFVLEDGGEIIQSVHRSWVEIAGLDVTQAIGFMLRVPTASPVCPMLLPEQASDVDMKLDTARSFLKQTMAHKPGDHRVVHYSIRIVRVTDIQTQEETFSADLAITMTYRVTRKDVFAYVVKPLGWAPAWNSKDMRVRNAVRSVDIDVTHRKPQLVVCDHGDGELEVCASRTVEYSGKFKTEYSLDAFPFDVQTLSIEFRLNTSEFGVEYVCKDGTRDNIRPWTYREDNSEWDAIDAWTEVEGSSEDKAGGDAGFTEVRAVVRMDRVSFVYIMRIVCVNLLIMILALCIFVLDLQDDLGDRLGHAYTMLLTAVAYNLVIADSIPTLGYLTWLDEYIFGTYFFLAALVAEFTLVASPLIDREKSGDLDRAFLFFDMAMLLLMQVFFYVTAKSEINRTKRLRAHARDVELKMKKKVPFLAETTKIAEVETVTDLQSVLAKIARGPPLTELTAAIKVQTAWRKQGEAEQAGVEAKGDVRKDYSGSDERPRKPAAAKAGGVRSSGKKQPSIALKVRALTREEDSKPLIAPAKTRQQQRQNQPKNAAGVEDI